MLMKFREKIDATCVVLFIVLIAYTFWFYVPWGAPKPHDNHYLVATFNDLVGMTVGPINAEACEERRAFFALNLIEKRSELKVRLLYSSHLEYEEFSKAEIDIMSSDIRFFCRKFDKRPELETVLD